MEFLMEGKAQSDTQGVSESAYHRGSRAFQEGRFEEAADALAESLRENESSEVWNDWAVAELAAGQRKAEEGFKRALALDLGNVQAIANYGVFLARQGRRVEAVPYLQSALQTAAEPERAVMKQLLDSCSGGVARAAEQSREEFWKRLNDIQAQFPSALGKVAARPPFDGSERALRMLKHEISKIDWYHQIDLGNRIITPGCHYSSEELQALALPARLDGMSVLDIGAWDGFFSFEAERRRAKRVLATDGFAWRGRCPRASKLGFDLARWALNSKVEEFVGNAMELSPEKFGGFDIVLMEALYGQRQFLVPLERAYHLTKQLLILRTHVELFSMERPAVAFYPHVEFAPDASNWWGPNPGAVVEMLRAVGFRNVKMVTNDFSDPAASDESSTRHRAVFHAER
jgi:tRNA (mo5U34)-methyltransferase